jgi:hypothetical protein
VGRFVENVAPEAVMDHRVGLLGQYLPGYVKDKLLRGVHERVVAFLD